MQLNEITEGTPATIVYVTDTRAAVVTRRTAKRAYVATVETGPRYRENENLAEGEPPVILADGILDRVIGEPVSYTLKTREDGSVVGTRGDGMRVHFGHSVSRTDYKV